MRFKSFAACAFAAALLAGAGSAHAGPAGGFTDVASTFQPGATITIESPCFDNPDADYQGFTLTAGNVLLDFDTTYFSSTLTLTIPADTPAGTGLTLMGRCSKYVALPDNPYLLLEAYGPVYIVVGQGIVAELPSFGRSSTDLALVAGLLVLVGSAFVMVPRRRTA